MATADALELKSIQKFGNDLGKAYYYLYSEVSFLKIKWNEYKTVYRASIEQIDFLNRYAPFYFYLNQRIIFHDVLLHIAKLTDKEKSCGNDNLSLLKLKSILLSKNNYIDICNSIDSTIKTSEVLNSWRNKYLAHYDFYLLTNQNDGLLNEISITEIDAIISSIWEVIKILAKEAFSEDLADEVIPPLGGADLFLKKLKGEYSQRISIEEVP